MQSSKNNLLGLNFLLFIMAVILFGTAQAQAPQGFISRLIQIKYSTELYLSHAIKKGATQKIGQVHLFALGFKGSDLINFKCKLNNPSHIAELQSLNN